VRLPIHRHKKTRIRGQIYHILTSRHFSVLYDFFRSLLKDAIDAYLDELKLKVANGSRRPKTLAASRLALNEFADQSGVKLLHGVTANVIATHMAWVIENSPTKSARTAANKFLLILHFLKHTESVPMVGTGKSARPLGMKDAPHYTESEVETYTDDELRRFFAACGPREEAVFQTFLRAGLREQELSTLWRIDCRLDQPAPCLKVVERPEYQFVPKAYQVRDVTIDPRLAATLRMWLASHSHPLVFPNSRTNGEPGSGSRVDGHLLRLCKTVAKRADMQPDRFWLHKSRANFATACLRAHMDLESLRRQMGHRDVESLRRYIRAIAKEECAEKMAEVDFGVGTANCKTAAAHIV
jgi:integrase